VLRQAQSDPGKTGLDPPRSPPNREPPRLRPVVDVNTKDVKMKDERARVTETPVRARGGFLDRPVLAVLIVSTVVVIIGFIVAYRFL